MKKYYNLILMSLFCTSVFSQVEAYHFNASWNNANGVEWFGKISDANKKLMSIDDASVQKKYGIAIVPTIIIFDEGEEVKRFQADLSFKMAATREDVQDYIDELIINKF